MDKLPPELEAEAQEYAKELGDMAYVERLDTVREAMLAALAHNAKDAQRYRWLVNQCISEDQTESPAELVEDCWASAKANTKEVVDRWFDAAIAGEKGE